MTRSRGSHGWRLLLATGLVLLSHGSEARILKTRSSASSNWAPWSAIVVGSGLEFQTDSNQSEVDFPLLLEYSITQRLKLTLEPNFVYLAGKTSEDADRRRPGRLGDLGRI